MIAPHPKRLSEAERLAAPHSRGALETTGKNSLDCIVRMAGRLTSCPIALIALIDADHQWCEARMGLDASEAARGNAFNAQAIADPLRPLVVYDAALDPRFTADPLVMRPPGVRFYAGVSLVESEGLALGTLCVMDYEPREIRPDELDALKGLAQVIMVEFEARRTIRDGQMMVSDQKRQDVRFRQVVEAAPNAIVMVNPHGRIEMVNAQAELVFGYARTEMLGNAVEMLVPERFRAHHPGLRGLFFSGQRSRPMGADRDLYGLRSDGSEFPLEIGLNPIETEDGTMVLSAIADISDRKQKEDRVRTALHEKEILLREIHHRVKNNLQIVHSLLDLQSGRISDKAARDMLRVSQSRIRSMALIHQTLYASNDFAKVDFGRFLDSLVPGLIASYGVDSSRISVHVDVDPVRLPIDSAVPCGLVVNELITNALKHAFGGRDHGEIRVALTCLANNETELSVSDDGIGIPDGIDISMTDTLGLQLVGLLADQLGGTITIHRSNPTRFVVKFPTKR